MRAVVQRVLSASVEVEGKLVSSIGPGLLCLVGLGKGDKEEDAEFLARKILTTRMWNNEEEEKKWSKSVTDKGYEILLVSQFTLFHKFKGTRLDFHLAMGPGEAKEAYASFVERIRRDYEANKVKDGIFGAMMNVSLVNDGPVTIIVDSSTK